MFMGVQMPTDAKTNQTKTKKRGRKEFFVPSYHDAFVAKMLDKDCTLTLKQLVDLCK